MRGYDYAGNLYWPLKDESEFYEKISTFAARNKISNHILIYN